MCRPQLALILVLLLGAGCATPKKVATPVRPTGFDPMFYGVREPIQDPDIIVATVEKVSAGPATNGNPPRVVLLIHEVLRGDLRPGTTIAAQWSARCHGVDYVGADAAQQIKSWAERPMEKPVVGRKFLLAGDRQGQDPRLFHVNGSGKLEFTPRARRDVIDQIAAFDAAMERERAKRVTEEKALEEARTQRRANQSSDRIRALSAASTTVAVGTMSSASGSTPSDYLVDFRVDELLKGTPCDKGADGRAYVRRIPIERATFRLLDRNTRYVLLLVDRGVASDRVRMYRTTDADGIFAADEAAVRAARDAVEASPGS